ncbi:hypothetical protein PGTUg99_032650 [Puccinia graminis f. sp. tritici]|uniref:Uncharacterized protein n=2 Tax=Puccinia graminis f. sp. tritici TaxID=56615 RepID=A0A5B0RZU5_PUCGR|nr:hypothetical protein PGTUg99_032650 [Puccinia graminis f. sp. tritici]
MKRLLRCVLILWPQIRLVRPGQSRQTLEAPRVEINFWADHGLRDEPNLQSTEVNLGHTGWELASNPLESKPSGEPREIDFIGSWGQGNSEHNVPNKRPLSLHQNQLSEMNEENNYHSHPEKRLKVQLVSNPRTASLLQQFQLSVTPDRVSRTVDLLSSSHFPAISRGSIVEKYPFPHSRVELILPGSSGDARKSIEAAEGVVPPLSHQKSLVDLNEDPDREINTGSSRTFKDSHPGKDDHPAIISIQQQNAESKKDHVYFRQIDPKLSAWLYSVKLGLTESLYKEITEKNEKDISSFIKTLALKLNPSMNENRRAKIFIDELTSHKSSNNLKEFAHLLWCINSAFIMRFEPTENHYFEEQLSVHDWILNLFEETRPSESASMENQNTEASLTNLLRKALASRYSFPSYVIYKNLDLVLPTGVVCESQIRMAEAVINVLASYYKSKNSIKWTSLFNRDEDFLNALKRSRSWNPRPSQYALNWIDAEGKGIATLIPWENDNLGGSMLARYKFLDPRGDFQLKNRVEKIEESLEPHKTLMTNFKPVGKWMSQEKPEKSWALILAIGTFYNNFIEEKFGPPYCGDMIKELEAWRFKTKDNNLNLENSHDKSLRKKFCTNVQNLFELIWKINSRP